MNPEYDQPAHGLRSAYEGQQSQAFDLTAPIATPLELHQCRVKQEWVDYNKHMSESCYLFVFGDNSDAFFRYFGIDDHYRARGYSIYTLETHMRHFHEVQLGEPLRLTLRLIAWDHKRLHVFHEMYHATSGKLLAAAEQLQTYVDMRSARAASFPDELQQRLDLIHTAHANAPLPAGLGRVIAIGRANTRS
ncbi:thioesterase family protein [Paraburkholderia sediminicola]|uniref:thioesterase family protein n=1 Tax=Paraburkholderia sediminicola TaxID=458836 RepID=UPI0038BA6D37